MLPAMNAPHRAQEPTELEGATFMLTPSAIDHAYARRFIARADMLLRSVFGDLPELDTRTPAPPTLAETEREFLVAIDVLGKESVDVECGDRTLTVTSRAQRRRAELSSDDAGGDVVEREIALPAGVDRSRCLASLIDGVLTVHLPKYPLQPSLAGLSVEC